MAAATERLNTYSKSLSEDEALELSYPELLRNDEEASTDDVSVDLLIHTKMQQLRLLKFELIEKRTRELFMQSVLSAPSAFNSIPSTQEAAALEFEVAQAKAELRKTKASRSSEEEQLQNVASQVGSLGQEREQMHDMLQRSIADAKAAARLKMVNDILDSGDEQQLVSLVKDVEDLDSECCKATTRVLQDMKAELQRKTAAQTAVDESLKAEVGSLDTEVRKMEEKEKALKARISKVEHENADAVQLRHECMLQKNLGEMLAALTGVRIAKVEERSVSFEICARLHALRHGKRDSLPSTHRLEVSLDESVSESAAVVTMALHPPDVDISDLYQDLSYTLARAVQIVYTRLLLL